MTFRTLNAAVATGIPVNPNLVAPLETDGSARAEYSGTVQGGSFGICGSLLSILCTGTAQIRIPIAVFQDHPILNPVAADDWYWFMLNRWYDVTYYAVARSHVPDAASHNCSTAAPVDCLSIAGGNPANLVQATLTFGGRSLTGMVRPNTSLADLLDVAENQDDDSEFVQNRVNRNFNDRFISLGNY
jgi:hypothetical protein